MKYATAFSFSSRNNQHYNQEKRPDLAILECWLFLVCIESSTFPHFVLFPPQIFFALHLLLSPRSFGRILLKASQILRLDHASAPLQAEVDVASSRLYLRDANIFFRVKSIIASEVHLSLNANLIEATLLRIRAPLGMEEVQDLLKASFCAARKRRQQQMFEPLFFWQPNALTEFATASAVSCILQTSHILQ